MGGLPIILTSVRLCLVRKVRYGLLEFQGHTGLEILAPAGGFLTSLERMFASLTFSIIIMIIEKCLSPPLSCVREMFVPRGTNKLFVPPQLCVRNVCPPGDKQIVCPPGDKQKRTPD